MTTALASAPADAPATDVRPRSHPAGSAVTFTATHPNRHLHKRTGRVFHVDHPGRVFALHHVLVGGNVTTAYSGEIEVAR